MARKLALFALLAAAALAGPASAAELEDKVSDLKAKADGLLGDALSAKEAAKAEVEAKESKIRSKAEIGYPFDLYDDCIRTAAEWKAAFEAGEVKCVAPWLYFRAPDSAADLADPEAAAMYVKGPGIAWAFAGPGQGTEGVLGASKECKEQVPPCSPKELVEKIFAYFQIDPSSYPDDAKFVLKIFGTDASIFLGTNKGVKRIVPTWPTMFDAITTEYKLCPKLLGDGPLRTLVKAYSTEPTTGDAYQSVTGCPAGDSAPSCANQTANSLDSKCTEYAAALGEFCTAEGTPNYDTQACVNALKAQDTDGDGAVTAPVARAFFTACFDTYYGFTANGFANPPELTSREYLVTGDAKLSQTGGYELIYLS